MKTQDLSKDWPEWLDFEEFIFMDEDGEYEY